MRIKSLLLITGNQGKAQEFKELLELADLQFTHQKYDLAEIQSGDIEAIGRFKTELAFSLLQAPYPDAILTDDTALCFDALNGLPGPFIKFFLDSLGTCGLEELTANKSRSAQAVCQLTLGLTKTKEIFSFQGVCPGKIIPASGEKGFGWDGIFQPLGEKYSFAEMSFSEKNKISHRKLAVDQLRDWIQGN